MDVTYKQGPASRKNKDKQTPNQDANETASYVLVQVQYFRNLYTQFLFHNSFNWASI